MHENPENWLDVIVWYTYADSKINKAKLNIKIIQFLFQLKEP